MDKWLSLILTQDTVNRKQLEKDRGFMVHLAMVYPTFVPYLKGFHLTLETWRPDRDDAGWKLPANEWIRIQNHFLEKGEDPPSLLLDHKDAPTCVKIVPRLVDDLKALQVLLEDATPPLRVIRSKLLRSMGLSFVDASGTGRGSSTISTSKGISIQMGKTTIKESSNYLELENLVKTIEIEHSAGRLTNVELFLCTDNIVSERAFYKGNSKNRKLFDLILRLRKFQLISHCKLHVLHVAGTRMIEQGTDGLSRGTPFEGLVGSNVNFLKCLPLDKTVFERSPTVRDWLQSWLPDCIAYLSPSDWFEKGHDIQGWNKSNENKWMPVIESGYYVWSPPPAAAYKALEQLRIARHKRLKSTQIFLCPRLSTSQWRAQLHKSADLIFEVPPSTPYWDKTMHEPIVVGLYFPTFQHQPWFVKGTPWADDTVAVLRAKFKAQEDIVHILKEAMDLSKKLQVTDAENVHHLLKFKPR